METAIKLDKSDSKEYEGDIKELDSGHHLPGLYYLVSWKSYPEEENIGKPTLVVLHLCKLISTFYCDYPEKPTATSPPIDSVLPITRPTVKPRAEALSTKQKQSKPLKDSSASKCAKKTWTSSFLSRFWLYLDSRQKIPTIMWSHSAPLRPTV